MSNPTRKVLSENCILYAARPHITSCLSAGCVGSTNDKLILKVENAAAFFYPAGHADTPQKGMLFRSECSRCGALYYVHGYTPEPHLAGGFNPTKSVWPEAIAGLNHSVP